MTGHSQNKQHAIDNGTNPTFPNVPHQSHQQWQENLQQDDWDLGIRGEQEQEPPYINHNNSYNSQNQLPLQNHTQGTRQVLRPQQLNINQQSQRSHSNSQASTSTSTRKKKKKSKKKKKQQEVIIQVTHHNQHTMSSQPRTRSKGTVETESDVQLANAKGSPQKVNSDLQFEGKPFVMPNNLKSCKTMLRRAVVGLASLTMDHQRVQEEAREWKKKALANGPRVKVNEKIIKEVGDAFIAWQF